MRVLTILFALTALSGLNLAMADELFEADDTLEITLAGPFTEMSKDRDKARQWPGLLEHEGLQFQVDLSHRGNRRLTKDVCAYPPLRLDFKKKEIKGTWLAEQDDIKLVVQCGKSSTYGDYLRLEYLIYKMFNELSPASYRVRWLQALYKDTGANLQESRSAPAFFVERKSRMAKRLALKKSELEEIGVHQLDPDQAALIGLFQYAIANPDYALTAGPPGDNCCHNAKLLEKPDGSLMPVIYDFDSAGIINARYAVPASAFPITKVTQRFYRGYCELNDHLDEAKARLMAKRERLLNLVTDDPILGKRTKKKAAKFLEKSFDNLTNAKKYEKDIIRRCR